MYIKQLTVKGFKSYRDETIFGPFSPHHNVIVGKNGSGKSNFFAAVRFVLHDSYARLMGDQKQALLHDHGTSGLSGYVEIVFENAEGRFPNNRETATIRRTVGLQKDEYSLDGKSASKQDILSMLEHAGFSKSNPYYIVPQGRVAALTTAKDSERLALLKEVAGTRTYEEHRLESLKILEETAGKREKIRELLEFIEERMRELAEERAELAAFQERDRERRAIEIVLQNRELAMVSEELTELEGEHQRMLQLPDSGKGSMEAFDELTSQIHTFEAQLTTLKEELQAAEVELHAEEEQREGLIKDQMTLSLQVNEMEQKWQVQEAEAKHLEAVLNKTEAEIAFKEDALAAQLPVLQSKELKREQFRQQIQEAEARQETLRAKQGRSAQFRSAAERDRFIRRELETMEASVFQHTRQMESLAEEITSVELKVNDLTGTISALEERQSREIEELRSAEGQLMDLRRRHTTLIEQRKELWRAENKLETAIGLIKEETARQERALSGATERGAITGISMVRRLAESLGVADGVYGPLYELFEVDQTFRLAAETIAGPSLFHIVVDNEQTASRLLEAMVRERGGRVTFMPLNRLRPPSVAFPPRSDTDGSENAIPLIEQLRYDGRFEAAFRQVFGKAIICTDLGKGAALARELGLTAITLRGDRADKRGALTGGYIEGGESKLELATKFRAGQLRLTEHQRLLAEVKVKLRELEPQINRLVGEIEASECRRSELTSLRGSSVARKLDEKRRELAQVQEIAALKNKARRQATALVGVLQREIVSLKEELGTPLNARLSAAEQEELQELGKKIDYWNEQFKVIVQEVTAMASEVSLLENELDMNLRKQRQELRTKLANIIGPTIQSELSQARASLEKTSFEVQMADRSISELAERIKHLQDRLTQLQHTLDQTRANHDAVRQHHVGRNATLEKYLTKRMALLERRDGLQRRVRELAMSGDQIAEPQTTSLSGESDSTLMRRLHATNEELRTRFAHVNKRAHEQHADFIQQGETLRSRQADLEKSAKAINEFICSLDRRKEEAIDRTFQQVASGFSEMFEKLVPAGRGELVMIRADDEDGGKNMDVDENHEQRLPDQSASRFDLVGVGIKVSFNSKGEEGLLMPQLSGGQKSLVALALILAIQKCDPAPFYLFDEIDANLDAAYRTSVARLIAEMKPQAQFITTTFRPELCEGADAFWGVTFGDRVSRVMPISREQALHFVEADPSVTTPTELPRR